MKRQTINTILIIFLVLGMLYVLSLKNETDKKFKNIQQRIEEVKKENFKLIDDKITERILISLKKK